MGVSQYQHIMSFSSGVSMRWMYVPSGTSCFESEILPSYPQARSKYIERPVYRDRVETVVVEKPIVKTITQKEVIYMKWDIWNILIVCLICAVTVKFILPRLTLRNIIKTAIAVVVWPFTRLTKKAIKEAESAWKEEEAKGE